ncbi:unnamed protein product [Rotaria sordida]|uniref:Uncharacterized protein n=1 Tax=Rotaria sordida TaxID=392033 RepID=A0A814P4I2_9BILA|nr:unnamed protein product [Rotaria sordida]CAF1102757.1 unnamed protein product [Rotaria sordida]CAF3751452.1 unnamed protein product [Rotaria sordida]
MNIIHPLVSTDVMDDYETISTRMNKSNQCDIRTGIRYNNRTKRNVSSRFVQKKKCPPSNDKKKQHKHESFHK